MFLAVFMKGARNPDAVGLSAICVLDINAYVICM